LVHEVEYGGFFVGFVEDVDLLFEVVVVDVAATFEELLEVFGTDAVTLVEGFEDAVAAGDLPVDAFAEFVADGLAGVEVEGVVSEEGGFDAGDVEGVDAVAEGEAWGEAVVEAFLGFDGGFAVEGEVNLARERFEEAFFIDDAGLQDGGDEGLAAFHGVIESDAEARGIGATGFGSGLGEEINEAGGGHVERGDAWRVNAGGGRKLFGDWEK
jgi:hypothetical protein